VPQALTLPAKKLKLQSKQHALVLAQAAILAVNKTFEILPTAWKRSQAVVVFSHSILSIFLLSKK